MVWIYLSAGVEGEDEALLNMVMHVHGRHRHANVFTGSSAKVPIAEDYPPKGLIAIPSVTFACT